MVQLLHVEASFTVAFDNCFNSLMVQLLQRRYTLSYAVKAWFQFPNGTIITLSCVDCLAVLLAFQFPNGTIITENGNYTNVHNQCFNSLMVQLLRSG